MSRDKTVITVENLFFSYDHVPVLENVSLTVEQGQFLSIIGPNGGGKTTLLKLILGLLKPSSGRITVLGKTPERVRHRIGYVPQYQQFDPQFPVTVLDVVLMGRMGAGMQFYSGEDRKAAREALSTVGLEGIDERSFSELSGGQRQRVLIARALSGNPEILILDEPTASVDASVRNKLSEVLEELNHNLTILLTTHDVGFVTPSVKGVVCVNRRVVFHPTKQIDSDMIRETYGTEMNLVRHDLFCTDEALKND